MKKYSIVLLIFIALLSAACQPLTPVPPNLSAVLTEIEGRNVNVLHSGALEFQPARLNEKLEINAQVNTGLESRAKLDLSSGTVIRISPESVFILESNHETEAGLFTRVKVELGQIWIILNGGTLEVKIPSGLAGVRGSYMSTGYDPETGATRITCLEGECSAENEAGVVNFTAGEAADLPADGSAPLKGLMTEDEFKTWAENVPEADEVLPEEYRNSSPPTPTSTVLPTATATIMPTPTLGTCTVNSTYLYVRTCPDLACETLGYAELNDELLLASTQTTEGWTAIIFDGAEAWVNSQYCE